LTAQTHVRENAYPCATHAVDVGRGERTLEDRDRETLEVALIELCASIVRDTDALTELVDLAEKRRPVQ
jgi:hypothetical protein